MLLSEKEKTGCQQQSKEKDPSMQKQGSSAGRMILTESPHGIVSFWKEKWSCFTVCDEKKKGAHFH